MWLPGTDTGQTAGTRSPDAQKGLKKNEINCLPRFLKGNPMATAKKANPIPAAGRTKRASKPAAAPETKPAVAPESKPVAKQAKTRSQPVAPTPSPKAATGEPKAKRVKMIRDGFTIPKDEYQVLEALKLRAGSLGTPSKKSELLRAGIKALVAMPDAGLLAALHAVPAIKTGRPGKD